MEYLGHYLNGAFEFSKRDKLTKSRAHISPADFKDTIFFLPKKRKILLDTIFKNGRKAYLNWSQLSLEQRKEKLLPLKKIIQDQMPELSEIVSRETGKPLWESEGEVKSLISKVNFVLGKGLNRIKEQDIPEAQGRIRFKSRGVLVVIGPFNFPLHLAFGQLLPSLISGNSVIFKPSEKTPASGQKLAECFHKLNLPASVFQMVQGEEKISKDLCSHKKGDGVLFTGSFATGQKIKEALVKDYWKILVLEMGGYNSTLIWDYKNKKQVLNETLKSCFWSAGQRCSSTSQILIHKNLAPDFVKDFVSLTKNISVNHWKKNPFMGSLIDKAALERFFVFQKQVQKEGGEILLEGQQIKKKDGYFVTPAIYKMKYNKNSSLTKKESFTPQVILYETENLDEALEMINHSGYGLALSVFSQKESIKEELFHRAKVGLINYNLSSVGASGYLPFGGLGKSGNNRPAGAFALDFCVSPLAEKS